MMIELADFINACTKNSKMKHCPCLRFTDPTCKINRPEKIARKIDLQLKFTSLNIPLLNNLQYQHCMYI